MMMRNKVDESAPLYPFLISFQIYKIKEGHLQDLVTLQMSKETWMNLQIHVVDKEVEGSGNQTKKETTNTN